MNQGQGIGPATTTAVFKNDDEKWTKENDNLVGVNGVDDRIIRSDESMMVLETMSDKDWNAEKKNLVLPENTAHNNDDDLLITTSTTSSDLLLVSEEEVGEGEGDEEDNNWDKEIQDDGQMRKIEQQDEEDDGDDDDDDDDVDDYSEYDTEDDDSSCTSIDTLEDDDDDDNHDGINDSNQLMLSPPIVEEEAYQDEDETVDEKEEHHQQDDEVNKETRNGCDQDDEQKPMEFQVKLTKQSCSTNMNKEKNINNNKNNTHVDEAVIAEQLTEGPLRVAFLQLLVQRDQTNLRNLQLQQHLNRAEKQLEELTDRLNKSTTFVSLRYNADTAKGTSMTRSNERNVQAVPSNPPSSITTTTPARTIPESNPSSEPLFQSIKTSFNAGSKPLKWLMKGQKITQFGVSGVSTTSHSNKTVYHPPYKPATTCRRLRPWSPRNDKSNNNNNIKDDDDGDDDNRSIGSLTAGDGLGKQSPSYGSSKDIPDLGETVTFYPIRTSDRSTYMMDDSNDNDGDDSNKGTRQRVEI